MNQRTSAFLSGFILIAMAIVAGYVFGYAYPQFFNSGADELNTISPINNKGLYQGMLFGIVIILLLDLWVSYTLYQFFKPIQQRLSLSAAWIRVVYTLIFGLATSYLVFNLYPTGWKEVEAHFFLFETIWNAGLIVFGFHVLLLGVLMKMHSSIPKVLWIITGIAGASYVLVHLLKSSTSADWVLTIELILALPMALGELGLAVWLLVRGGKSSMNEQFPKLTE